MPTILKCICGHRWILDSESNSGIRGKSRVCPVCGELVDTAVMGSGDQEEMLSDTVVSPVPCSNLPDGSPTLDTIAGYEIHGIVGSGGMGIVYRAFSPKLNRFVALKTLQRIDALALQRFKREFRALAGVSHPNLVPLYELVSDGEAWFFSMELVDGVDLLTYVNSGVNRHADEQPADDEDDSRLPLLKLIRIRRSFAQLASAVGALHRAGVLHRDIKPSNMLVTKDERLVLLDFGLVAELGESDSQLSTGDHVVGTAAFMAPEQATEGPVSEAGDWYSVGVVLYQSLTGTLPFVGKAVDILLEKQHREPPPPETLVRHVPEDLNALCIDLLHTDPRQRPSEQEILQRFGATGTGEKAPEAADSRAGGAIPLVGRDHHFAELENAYWDVERGQAVVVFVEGPSGMGKSFLVQHFLDDVKQRRQAVVLTGRCYEQESVPFKALDSLIDSLCHHLRHLPGALADSLMPRDIQALIRVFPVLARVEAAFRASRRALEFADQQELRRRAVAALRELLARLGDRHPLVLFIDDLQWGDVDSALMLCDLLKPPDPPLMLFIGACRSEDAEGSPFLTSVRATQQKGLHPLEVRRLAVGPLGESDAASLAELLLHHHGSASHRHVQLIARESGGNPFFARELARYLASQEHTDGAKDVDLEEVLRFRLANLPGPVRQLLEAASVAGRPIAELDAIRASGHEADGPSLLTSLKADHLIRATSAEPEKFIEVYHDRIREAVLGMMAPSELQRVHLRLAEVIQSTLRISMERLTQFSRAERAPKAEDGSSVIEQADWQHVFDLAYHFGEAGEYARASTFALAAAEQARRLHSLETAAQQYRIAERGIPDDNVAMRGRVMEGLGNVLMLQGCYEEAARYFHLALPLAKDNSAKAEIEGKLGELAFKQGDMKTASEIIERALARLGKKTPRSKPAWWMLLAVETLVQVLHSLFPRWYLGRRKLQDAEDELLAARLFGRVGHAYWFERGVVATLATHLRGMNLAERYPSTPELAQSYSEHAPAMSLLPYFSRGIEYANRSLAVRKELGDVWGQAQSLHFHGIVLYAASRFEECIEKCREAIRLFDQTGDYWELNMARYQLSASLYRLGDLRNASEEARKMYESGLELADVQASGLAVDIVAKATIGRLPGEMIDAELNRPRGNDAQTASQVLQAEGVRLFAESCFVEAAEAFRKGYEIARRAGIKNTYVIPCLPWRATALRRAAERIQTEDPEIARKYLRQAYQAARTGLKLARRFQNDLPHVLRELALLRLASRRLPQARTYFKESLAIAERQGARYEHALTLLELGHMEQKAGEADGERKIAEANAALGAILQ